VRQFPVCRFAVRFSHLVGHSFIFPDSQDSFTFSSSCHQFSSHFDRFLNVASYNGTVIDHHILGWRLGMATATISQKFQVVIPKEVRERLHLRPKQRVQVLEKGGVITLIPDVSIKSLKGFAKGFSLTGLRVKKDRL
jgi:AbrB family looped-hinge helix DNA binding protein